MKKKIILSAAFIVVGVLAILVVLAFRFPISREEARLESDKRYGRATIFENQLNKTDIQMIVGNHPQSLFARLGYFTTQNPFRGKCDRKEYEKLKKALSLRTLHARYGTIVMLARMYDEQHMSDSIKNLRRLLEKDARWREYKDLDAYYAEVEEILKIKSGSRERHASEKSKREQMLIRSGVPKQSVRGYAVETAMSSPACFGYPQSHILKWVREDVTLLHGKYFLTRLKAYWKLHGKIPPHLPNFLSSEKDPHPEYEVDGAYIPFQVSEDKKEKFVLFSTGEDAVAGTEDDVIFGSILE